MRDCPYCGGTGIDSMDGGQCHHCDGTGTVGEYNKYDDEYYEDDYDDFDDDYDDDYDEDEEFE